MILKTITPKIDFYVCGLPPCNFCIEINLIELELSKFNINPFKNSNV